MHVFIFTLTNTVSEFSTLLMLIPVNGHKISSVHVVIGVKCKWHFICSYKYLRNYYIIHG